MMSTLALGTAVAHKHARYSVFNAAMHHKKKERRAVICHHVSINDLVDIFMYTYFYMTKNIYILNMTCF